MSRVLWTGLLITALLASAPGVGAAHPSVPHRPSGPIGLLPAPVVPKQIVEVAGVLQYRADGPARYEVSGYILLGIDPAEEEQLYPLLGRNVVVTGELIRTPSIYMRRAIQVQQIHPDDVVTIPANPPHRLLFGRVEQDCETAFLVQQETGPRPRLVGMDLSHLVGQPVAVAAEEEVTSHGVQIYRVYRVFPLVEDLAPYLGTFYHRPADPILVTLAGRPVIMDQAPVMANDRVLVGLRAIAEAMGAKVSWNEEMRQVVVHRGNRQVVMRIGSPQIQTWEAGQDPSHFTTDITPVLIGGRTMVPIRVLADGLGLKVNWDPTSWTVHLY